MNKDNGLFITCEGGDGSGKSTVMNDVLKKLKDEGYVFFLTREPGGNRISEEIRKIILDKKYIGEDPKTEALLYAASRRQNMVDTVFPLLNEGKVVISDRYVDSSLVYQGYARGLGIDEVLKINMFAIDGRLPDMTVFFDVRPEICLKRISTERADKTDRLDSEKLSFHQKVYEGYKLMAEKFSSRYVVIDASKPLDIVEADFYKIIKDKLDGFMNR